MNTFTYLGFNRWDVCAAWFTLSLVMLLLNFHSGSPLGIISAAFGLFCFGALLLGAIFYGEG